MCRRCQSAGPLVAVLWTLLAFALLWVYARVDGAACAVLARVRAWR